MDTKLIGIIKRKIIELLGRHLFTAGWDELNRNRFAETITRAVMEEIQDQARYAELEQAAREYLNKSTAPKIYGDYCLYCKGDQGVHTDVCEYQVAADKLAILLAK